MQPFGYYVSSSHTIYAPLDIPVVFEAASTSLVFAQSLAECADYIKNGWKCAEECQEFLEAGL
jgi:hypothetical protein